MGQISSNLFKKGVCKMIVCRHFCSGMRGNQNFEILNEKVTYVFRLFVFLNFFCAFPFLLLLAVDQLGLLPVQKSVIAMGKSYYGVAICSRKQFFSEVFSQISEHFRTCFRLHWANHSDLGIIGKIFSSSRTWVQIMPILVKGDDVRREIKANARHSWSARQSMG